MTMKTTQHSKSGLQASNATPSGRLKESFIFYSLQTNAGKVFAIDPYFEMELVDSSQYKLSELDWEILEGLELVLMALNTIALQIPHEFQQSMSSESTLVLSCAIVYFEMFMTKLENLREQHRVLRPWTEIAL
ncbi:hypothetical protein BJV78DRAFT_1158179 [Lactifluus subvellereus]|nr:hypothetical protein BJV78DRAFT_1158179 [Lactifluus subvellereus]